MTIALLPRGMAVISLDEPTNHFAHTPKTTSG
jgi:hypothetical protein